MHGGWIDDKMHTMLCSPEGTSAVVIGFHILAQGRLLFHESNNIGRDLSHIGGGGGTTFAIRLDDPGCSAELADDGSPVPDVGSL